MHLRFDRFVLWMKLGSGRTQCVPATAFHFLVLCCVQRCMPLHQLLRAEAQQLRCPSCAARGTCLMRAHYPPKFGSMCLFRHMPLIASFCMPARAADSHLCVLHASLLPVCHGFLTIHIRALESKAACGLRLWAVCGAARYIDELYCYKLCRSMCICDCLLQQFEVWQFQGAFLKAQDHCSMPAESFCVLLTAAAACAAKSGTSGQV